MKTIYLKGSPYEIGLQTGKTFSKQIKEYVKYRKETLLYEVSKEEYTISMYDIYQLILPILQNPWVKDCTLEELYGVADGAHVDIVDVFMAIGYTDILDLCISRLCLQNEKRQYSNERNQECTTFTIRNNNKLYLGQNWDMDPVSSENICLFFKQYSSGSRLLSLSTILGATHIGMNDKGTAVGTANLSSYINREGIIFPQVIQRLLLSRCKQSNLDFINLNNRMAGHYYYVGYSDQSCHLFETTADNYFDFGVDKKGDFKFSHTNHYQYSAFTEVSNNYSSSSNMRKHNMDIILNKYATIEMTQININRLFNDLGDHKYGICRHVTDEDTIMTCASVMFIPQEKIAYICEGTPCKGRWVQYDLTNVFQ